jgi:hypothetical protein
VSTPAGYGKNVLISSWLEASDFPDAWVFLDNRWSDRPWEMRIENSNPAGQSPVTTLVGRLRDQAALIGVLNSLDELHLPILSVEHQDELKQQKPFDHNQPQPRNRGVFLTTGNAG